MKKITNLLIVCSLALAGAVTAQEPTPEESPGSKKQRPDKKAPAAVKPKAPAAPKTEAPAAAPKTEAPAVKDPAATRAPAVTKPEKKAPDASKAAPAAPTETSTSAEQPATSVTPADKKQPSRQRDSEAKKSPAPTADTSPSATAATTRTTATTTPAAAAKATSTPAAATTASTTPAAKATATAAATTPAPATTTASATPAAATTASTTPAAAQTSPAATVNPNAAKKPEPQKIEQIRQRTATFSAQPRPDRVPAVTFTPNYRIQGAEQWQGPQYEVYRTYRPERRDQAYYQSRYRRVELIAGGYYYFDNNYWYPAWGYDPRNEYYAYDAPIYAGKRALPPDKVIAEVQAVLQEMGYYKGEVDGLIGPLTRAALTGYQRDNGMTVTAVIDEPTLESLDMG
jgi:Putative peptidoglycan binding domain